MKNSSEVFITFGILLWMQCFVAFGYRKIVNESPIDVNKILLNEVSSEILDASRENSVSYGAGKESEKQEANEAKEQGTSNGEDGLIIKNSTHEKQNAEEDDYPDGSGEGDIIDKGVCICTLNQKDQNDDKEEESGSGDETDSDENIGKDNKSGEVDDATPGDENIQPETEIDGIEEVNTQQGVVTGNKEQDNKTKPGDGGSVFTFSPLHV